MTEIFRIKHPIDVYIMTMLADQECVRFVDLKDKKTDTNLLTYHLKKLQSHDYILKVDAGYTLSQKGIYYVYNLTKSLDMPDVIVSLLVQNSEGDVLLVKRTTHPFINSWSLPFRIVGSDDRAIADTALRIGESTYDVRHVGDAYVRVVFESANVTSTLTHVFRTESDAFRIVGEHQWVQPHELMDTRLAPGTEKLITRSFFGDAFFFEEYEEPAILS
jgi:hypothetical protein